MKNNVGYFIYCFVLFCVLLSLFSGCKAKKNVQRELSVAEATERISKTIAKQNTETETGTHVNEETSEDIREFIREIRFDTAGNVQTIQEAWRDKGRVQLVVRRDTSRTVSVNEELNSDSIKTVTNVKQSDDIKQTTDSRPVQGIEWLWVILSIAIIATIAIILFIKKVK